METTAIENQITKLYTDFENFTITIGDARKLLLLKKSLINLFPRYCAILNDCDLVDLDSYVLNIKQFFLLSIVATLKNSGFTKSFITEFNFEHLVDENEVVLISVPLCKSESTYYFIDPDNSETYESVFEEIIEPTSELKTQQVSIVLNLYQIANHVYSLLTEISNNSINRV